MSDIKSHERVNDILLGPLERPALRWLAAHLPGWITPDILTGIGVVGTLVTFAGYWLTRFDHNYLWLASLGFIINWFGDSLDGTVARYRNIQRPRYGFFIDHIVDAFSEMMVFLGLGLSTYLHLELALIALVGYLMVSEMVFIQMLVTGVFQISYGKLGPTEARVIGILANTAVYILGNPTFALSIGVLSLYDFIAIGVIGLESGIFLTNTIKQARLLSAQDNAERLQIKAAAKEVKARKRSATRRKPKTITARSPLKTGFPPQSPEQSG